MFWAEGFSSFFFSLVPFNARLLSLSFSISLAFSNPRFSLRLAFTLVRQSGNPGIMNSQLSLAIPGLPANTTLYEFAQLLAWLFSDGERGREEERQKVRERARAREELYQKKMLTRRITHAGIWFASYRISLSIWSCSYSVTIIYILLDESRPTWSRGGF